MKPRKRKYQKDYTAFARVIAQTELFNEQERVNLTLPNRVSFQILLNGEAEETDVYRLVNTINVTLVRCWGTEMQPIAQRAQDALRRCWERYERMGVWGLDGPARSELEQGLELHEELVRLSTPLQMRDASLVVDEMRRRAA